MLFREHESQFVSRSLPLGSPAILRGFTGHVAAAPPLHSRSGFSGGNINCRIASMMEPICSSCFPTRASSSSNFRASSRFVSNIPLSFTNARMIAIFTYTARSLFSTLESMATPSSVNAWTCFENFRPDKDVTDCDILAISCRESRNMKSSGKRFALRFTA